MLFRCEGLTKKLGEYELKDVSFSLEKGMVLGLIGINGCGKTTLIRSILGSYRLDQSPEDAGELWIEDLHFLKQMKEYKGSMAYVMQDSPYPELMCAMEIGERYGHYYQGFDMEKFKGLLEEYEVPGKTITGNLSKGQVLRVQLAFALSYPAKLYVFDEPVGNLDVEFRDVFYETVRGLVAKEDCSVIISSHLITELEGIADELLWLGKEGEKGFIRYHGTIDELKEGYRILSTDESIEGVIPKDMIRGKKLRESHKEYLLWKADGKFQNVLPIGMQGSLRYPDLQEIMYYIEKENAK